ncbi:Protein of unknown function [Bacillus thuringiensis]|uniref:Uncharacterized protein n=1 Tax=Bacillus thuringiensis TaxID=1428 RepID=A0A1C4F7U0_BACTU|nr:Protein of unknown function [Bacillus thuringiensis]
MIGKLGKGYRKRVAS